MTALTSAEIANPLNTARSVRRTVVGGTGFRIPRWPLALDRLDGPEEGDRALGGRDGRGAAGPVGVDPCCGEGPRASDELPVRLVVLARKSDRQVVPEHLVRVLWRGRLAPL